jgi:hypothetical protein
MNKKEIKIRPQNGVPFGLCFTNESPEYSTALGAFSETPRKLPLSVIYAH